MSFALKKKATPCAKVVVSEMNVSNVDALVGAHRGIDKATGKRQHTDDEFTHLFTNTANADGDGFVVPDEEKFLTAYANDLVNKVIPFIFERKTPVFKMYLQFCVKCPDPQRDDKWIQFYISEMKRVMVLMYPGVAKDSNLFDMVLCFPPGPVRKIMNFTVICPNLLVDQYVWTTFRQYMIDFMVRRHEDAAHNQLPYSKLIVPFTNGLLLPKSRNLIPCQCKQLFNSADPVMALLASISVCSLCSGTGSVVNDEFLEPLWYYQHDPTHTYEETGESECVVKINLELSSTFQTNPAYYVRLCSIRSTSVNVTPGFQAKPGVIYVPDPTKPVEFSMEDLSIGIDERKEFEQNWRKKVVIPHNDERFRQLERLISSDHFISHYKKCRLVKLVQVANKNYMLNIEGPGQSFCMKINREHSDCDVYLMIDFKTEKLTQRCFNKTTCADFQSSPYEIPPKLANILFPGKPIKNKEFLSQRNPNPNPGSDEDDEFRDSMYAVIDKLDQGLAEYYIERAKRLEEARRAKGIITPVESAAAAAALPANPIQCTSRKRIRKVAK